ncbi:MAG TPA: multidrug ABC transporter ATP-binding protein [Polaromonas sp.]|nr:multidrug ABC transporter ATP-binding protein [Polaromonas sp.]
MSRPAFHLPRGGALLPGSVAGPRDMRGALRRMGRFLLGDHRRLALALAFTTASVVLGTLGPWQLGMATDLVVASIGQPGLPTGLVQQLAVVAVLYATASALQWAQAWLTTALVQALSKRLRRDAEAKLARLPLDWFDARPLGEVLSRVTNDIDNVTQSLQQLMSQLLMSLLTLLASFSMMGMLSPLLLAVAVVALALSAAGSRLVAARSKLHFEAQWRLTGELNAEVEQTFTGHVLVKAFGHRQRTLAEFAQVNGALADSAWRAQLLGGSAQPLTMFVGQLAFIAVVAGGAWRVLGGHLSIGQLQAFIQYIRQIGQPMSQVSAMVAVVQSGLASAERVFELLDADELVPDADAPAKLPTPRGHVVFEHVRFGYRPGQPLLEDVNLEARPGQTVAIVGPTGAGKTTVVNLLMRFYEIDAGVIRLDGTDIRALRRDDLRRHFGMVLQDSWLFTGTIRENLVYGRPEASETEWREAAVACLVDDFVRTLPQGYDTVLEDGGAALSTGQRQLLTIARAFLMRPAVLILDEATSSVDTRTELLVQQAMARLRQGRTSFVIAHRLSTIRSADLIVYMDGGHVVEQGSHAQLIERRGAYWRLHEAQFGGTQNLTAG